MRGSASPARCASNVSIASAHEWLRSPPMSDTSARLTWQRCAECGNELTELDPRPVCPVCGGLLDVHHRAPYAMGGRLRIIFDDRVGFGAGAAHSGVWRFRELVLPGAGDDVLSYPEGNTPLLARPSVAAWAGATDLLLKHEGHNPTGSFKDRGMTVGVTHARRLRATAGPWASAGQHGA